MSRESAVSPIPSRRCSSLSTIEEREITDHCVKEEHIKQERGRKRSNDPNNRNRQKHRKSAQQQQNTEQRLKELKSENVALKKSLEQQIRLNSSVIVANPILCTEGSWPSSDANQNNLKLTNAKMSIPSCNKEIMFSTLGDDGIPTLQQSERSAFSSVIRKANECGNSIAAASTPFLPLRIANSSHLEYFRKTACMIPLFPHYFTPYSTTTSSDSALTQPLLHDELNRIQQQQSMHTVMLQKQQENYIHNTKNNIFDQSQPLNQPLFLDVSGTIKRDELLANGNNVDDSKTFKETPLDFSKKTGVITKTKEKFTVTGNTAAPSDSEYFIFFDNHTGRHPSEVEPISLNFNEKNVSDLIKSDIKGQQHQIHSPILLGIQTEASTRGQVDSTNVPPVLLSNYSTTGSSSFFDKQKSRLEIGSSHDGRVIPQIFPMPDSSNINMASFSNQIFLKQNQLPNPQYDTPEQLSVEFTNEKIHQKKKNNGGQNDSTNCQINSKKEDDGNCCASANSTSMLGTLLTTKSRNSSSPKVSASRTEICSGLINGMPAEDRNEKNAEDSSNQIQNKQNRNFYSDSEQSDNSPDSQNSISPTSTPPAECTMIIRGGDDKQSSSSSPSAGYFGDGDDNIAAEHTQSRDKFLKAHANFIENLVAADGSIQQVKMKTSEDLERYMDRRRRNNEAAKRCRANRRAVFEYRSRRAKMLETENGELRKEMVKLNDELEQLKSLIAANSALTQSQKHQHLTHIIK